MSSPVTLDMDALRQALEQRKADEIINLYADDAQIQVIDKNHPPSSPLILRGKSAIADFITGISSRDMTHAVSDEVIGKERISFNEACQYASGERVLSASVIDLRDGKITRHVMVQAWDE